MYDWIDLNNAFLHGDVAMVVQWSDTSRFSFDQKVWKSEIANKVDWTLVPAEDEKALRGGIWIGRRFRNNKVNLPIQILASHILYHPKNVSKQE